MNLFKAVGFFLVSAGFLVVGCSQEKNTRTAVGSVSTPPKMELEIMKQQAEQGVAAAQYNLALMYANGNEVPEDDIEAMKWYRMAAEQGHSLASYRLGVLFEIDNGVPPDNVEAFKWFRMAAEQGHPRAPYKVAVLYDNGNGVPEDNVEAYAWYFVAEYFGENKAVKPQDLIKKELTPSQLKKAGTLAAEYVEQYMEQYNKK